MSGVNVGKVIAGGLLAGLVVNVGEFVFNMFIAASAMRQAMERLNLPEMGVPWMIALTGLGFVAGIVLVWIYAAVRPRLGPGPGTAVKVGAAVWVFAYVVPGVANMAIGVFPEYPWALAFAWGLFEWAAAALAGGWAYREEAA